MSFLQTIPKLYASHFLTGFIFWYGIEKLFMQQIGLDPAAIGIATACFVGLTFLLDIPSGMIADRWSRKKLLMLSALFLATSSVVMVTSHNLAQYLVAEFFYALYIVTTSGTYQALIYDTLHEQNKSADYPKVIGRAFGIFMAGAGTAELLGGLLAQATNLYLPFWLSVIPCICNFFLLWTIHEPTFHKKALKEKFLRQINGAMRHIMRILLLRSLLLIWCALGFAEIFKQDFSQLYMMQFFNTPAALGVLWALYAFAVALGNVAAHYMQHRLNLLMFLTLILLILLGFIDNSWGLLLFMLQAAVASAAYVLVETQVQHTVTSSVRASILSVLSSGIRLVMIPSSFIIGWLTTFYNIFLVVHVIAALASMLLIYWLFIGQKRLGSGYTAA